jgi:hypothetical protein
MLLKTNNSVFIHKEKPIVLAMHIDDILVVAKEASLVNSLYKDLTYSTSKPATLVSRLLFLGTANTTYKL